MNHDARGAACSIAASTGFILHAATALLVYVLTGDENNACLTHATCPQWLIRTTTSDARSCTRISKTRARLLSASVGSQRVEFSVDSTYPSSHADAQTSPGTNNLEGYASNTFAVCTHGNYHPLIARECCRHAVLPLYKRLQGGCAFVVALDASIAWLRA